MTGTTLPRVVATPPELDDVDWLRERRQVASDRAIACELGVGLGAVRSALRHHGLTTSRRRWQPAPVVAPERVLARYERERRLGDGPAPSLRLILTRSRDAVLAFRDGAPDLIDEAVEALAVSALLVLDQEAARRAIGQQR